MKIMNRAFEKLKASQVGVIPYLSVITPILLILIYHTKIGTENYSRYQNDWDGKLNDVWCKML